MPSETSLGCSNNYTDKYQDNRGCEKSLGIYLPKTEDFPMDNGDGYAQSPDGKNHVYVLRPGSIDDPNKKGKDPNTNYSSFLNRNYTIGQEVAHELYFHGYDDLKNKDSSHDKPGNNERAKKIEQNAK